jgi:hypothetical protein
MPDREPPPDRTSLSDENERQRAIEGVLRDQARREVLRQSAYRPSGPSLRLRVVAGVLALVALIAWIAPVPGLRPDIPFPMPPAREEAGLHLAAWIQVQQIEAFRQRRGRLPDGLRQTGEAIPGMYYERVDAQTYVLKGETERVSMEWTSSDTLDARLREAAARLRGFAP